MVTQGVKGGNMLIKVKIHPKAKEQKVETDKEVWEAWVKSAPEKGKANKELVSLLKKELGKNVELVSGFKSRIKTVRVF